MALSKSEILEAITDKIKMIDEAMRLSDFPEDIQDRLMDKIEELVDLKMIIEAEDET